MTPDGYPTEEELETIRTWDHKDGLGLMAYVRERWALNRWREAEWSTEWPYGDADRGKRLFVLATGGWSGNEDMIRAMQGNIMFWTLSWYSSHRGGRYEFRVKNYQ
jgi:hypothetical protein